MLATAVESVATERDASEQMETLTQVVGQAGYLELSPTGIEVYEDGIGDFRWRLLAGDGTVLAESSEGHESRNAADEAAARFQSTVEASASGEDGPAIRALHGRRTSITGGSRRPTATSSRRRVRGTRIRSPATTR